MLIASIAIFWVALQPDIDEAEKKYYHRIDHRFLVYSELLKTGLGILDF